MMMMNVWNVQKMMKMRLLHHQLTTKRIQSQQPPTINNQATTTTKTTRRWTIRPYLSVNFAIKNSQINEHCDDIVVNIRTPNNTHAMSAERCINIALRWCCTRKPIRMFGVLCAIYVANHSFVHTGWKVTCCHTRRTLRSHAINVENNLKIRLCYEIISCDTMASNHFHVPNVVKHLQRRPSWQRTIGHIPEPNHSDVACAKSGTRQKVIWPYIFDRIPDRVLMNVICARWNLPITKCWSNTVSRTRESGHMFANYVIVHFDRKAHWIFICERIDLLWRRRRVENK